MNRYDLTVVMPVYNEAEAIGAVLRKWRAMLDGLGIRYRICAYNDGSKDATGKILAEVSAGSEGRIVGIDKPNSGHGPTILRGYRAAAEDSDWVFQIDSDDEMGPEDFPKLWEKREAYDFLVGRRAGRKQPLARRIVSLVSRLCVRIFYGKGIWDVNAPYRLMRAEAFSTLFRSIPEDTFAPNVIISGLAARHKMRMLEIPVPQHDRTTGEVSIKKWKLLKAAARSFLQTITYSFGAHGGLVAAGYLVAASFWAVVMQVRTLQNDFSYNAHVIQLMARGWQPLVDVHAMYTQLVYWLMLPIKWLLGPWFGMRAFLVIAFILTLAVARMVFVMARRLSCSRATSHGAAVTVMILSLYWNNFFEPWCALWGTGALCLFIVTRRWLFVSGMLVGAAYLSKQNALIWAPILGFAVLVFEKGWLNKFKAWTLLFVGFLLSVGAYLVFLRLMNGSWIATSTLLGDSAYHHASDGIRSSVEYIIGLMVFVVPAIFFFRNAKGEERHRLVFCLFASLLVLLVLFASPYPSNLLVGASVFALYFAVCASIGKDKTLAAGLWGAAIFPVLSAVLLTTTIESAAAVTKRRGGNINYPHLSAKLREIGDHNQDRLFVFPLKENIGSIVYLSFLYVESDLIPANIVVKHDRNLFWGAERLERDDEELDAAMDKATIVVVHGPMLDQFKTYWRNRKPLMRIDEVDGFVIFRVGL